MKIKKISFCYFAGLAFAYIFTANTAKAIPLAVSAYGSLSGSYVRDRYDGKDLNNIKNDLLDYKDTKKRRRICSWSCI